MKSFDFWLGLVCWLGTFLCVINHEMLYAIYLAIVGTNCNISYLFKRKQQ